MTKTSFALYSIAACAQSKLNQLENISPISDPNRYFVANVFTDSEDEYLRSIRAEIINKLMRLAK